jgi:hypothetical protein
MYARRLLEPQRKGLPAGLAADLARAVRAWDDHDPATGELLYAALTLAETLGEF